MRLVQQLHGSIQVVFLKGDNSIGEFYSIAISNNYQQVDSGTKMLHLGKNTKSRIISKGVSTGSSSNTYRGQVNIHPKSNNARNFTQCDSLLLTDKCSATTIPYVGQEIKLLLLSTKRPHRKYLMTNFFYCLQRGLDEEQAIALIVNGFCKEVLQKLPMEFAVEAQKLLEISLEGSVG